MVRNSTLFYLTLKNIKSLKLIFIVIYAVLQRRTTNMKIDFSKNTLIITLYNPENVSLIWNTIEEMEKKLCKKLDVDEDDFEEFNEIHIDVDDYYEYLAYRRLILDYTPIY